MVQSTIVSPWNGAKAGGGNADLLLDQGLQTPPRMRSTTTHKNKHNKPQPSTTLSKKTTTAAGQTASMFFNQTKKPPSIAEKSQNIIAASATISSSGNIRNHTNATIDHKEEGKQKVTTEGLLNPEQRQVVSKIIDKLDIQEAIRQKAKIFFHKEQKRLQEKNKKPSAIRTADQIPNLKQIGSKKAGQPADENESEAFYSERKVATKN